jgi:type II secretion system protein F
MQSYAYVAMDPSGRRRNGVLEAASKEAAVAQLSTEGRFVLEIKEEAVHKSAASALKSHHINASDVALFTRRMADLVEAGLPLDRVLHVVSEQSESAALQEIALKALEEVRAGKPVSEALAAYPRTFSPVYSQTLRAGEASGQFADVANRLADFQEMQVARKSQVVSALIYPAVLTITAISVVIFLVTFVIPRLSDVFKDLGGSLPLNTQILLAVSNFVVNNAMLIVGGIAIIVVAYRIWVATSAGATARDAILLKLPIAGPVFRKATVSRFARVLGTLVFGGVPILEALSIAGLSAGNRVYKASAEQVAVDVREGKPIAQAMRDAGAFPPLLIHMVAIGEETGDLPKMLGRVADSMDFEVDIALRRLTALLEPIIVLFMGTFVAFVVLSILLPILQVNNLVK